jgi:hypothetical protein
MPLLRTGRCVGVRPCAADDDRHGLGVRYAESGDRVPRADRGGHAVHRGAPLIDYPLTQAKLAKMAARFVVDARVLSIFEGAEETLALKVIARSLLGKCARPGHSVTGVEATMAAGMALAPVGVLAIVLSPVVGRQMARIDARWLTTLAFVIFALVLWMRSDFTPQADQWTIQWPTIVQGAAVACFFIPLMGITLSGLSADRLPAASGLSNFARITAGSFGTSIATTLWDDRATLHHAHLVERVGNVGDLALADAMAKLGAAGLSPEQIAAQLSRMIDQQAFTRAADDVFFGSAFLFLVLIGLVWFTRPARAPAAAGVEVG